MNGKKQRETESETEIERLYERWTADRERRTTPQPVDGGQVV